MGSEMCIRDRAPPVARARVSPARAGGVVRDARRPPWLGPTLVVVPTSLIGQWEGELRAHTRPRSLTVRTHYGGDRPSSASGFARAHVVLTTYGVVSSEWAEASAAKERGALFAPRLVWRRVILDEAHLIKARETRVSRACAALEAERRWAVTGTPMQNRLDDIFALLHFLRLPRFEDYRWWNAHVLRPFSERKDMGALRTLQRAIAPLLLRRTKRTLGADGKPIIVLPARVVRTVTLAFEPAERALYAELHEVSKQRFDALVASGAVLRHYMDVLTLLLRLRQLCDHPLLLRARSGTDASAEQLARKLARAAGADELPAGSSGGGSGAQRNFVSRVLADMGTSGAGRSGASAGASVSCPICLGALEDGVLTPCAHAFCRPCFLQTGGLHAHHALCPVCRTRVAKKALVTIPRENRFGTDIAASFEHSAKTRWLVAEIERLLARAHAGDDGAPAGDGAGGAHAVSVGEAGGAAKAVVFSQWTAMLDLVGHALSQRRIRHVRLDGSMSARSRDAACSAFSADEGIAVFLISLKAGGIGLNLTAANHVFLLDPWWNPAVEEQAIDRVYRIGQRRPVTVLRAVMEDSVEGRILRLQEKKRCLQGALRLNLVQDEDERASKLDLDDLKLLFER